LVCEMASKEVKKNKQLIRMILEIVLYPKQ